MAKRTAKSSDLPVDDRLEIAERVLGHTFTDRDLLRTALTHPSAGEVGDPSSYYERLEFLGDSIVGFLIAEELYRRYPDMPEGGMTRMKVSVVAGAMLAGVAADLGLTPALILGDSELGTGGRGLTSALENTFEALTAALYLEAGLDATRQWVLSALGPHLSVDAATSPENPKSALQEIVQARGETPHYKITGHEGPPHERRFTAVVLIDDRELGRGVGRTKKEAEAAAAAAALESLTQ